MMQFDIHPAAEAEVEDAMEWYEAQRAGLGVEFNEAVGAALDRIEERPVCGWKYKDQGQRVLALDRFPYCIYYSVEENAIFIHAVAHQRRKPDYWQNRVSD